jgi:peptidoglycan/LPS O-acetylase OafA/YrhL
VEEGWRNFLWLAAGIEVSILAANALYPLAYWIRFSPFAYWFSWSLGAALADDFMAGRPVFLRDCPLLVFPLATVVCFFTKPLEAFCFPAAALSTANVIAYLITFPNRQERGAISNRLLKFTAWVGTVSYSLYLLHEPIIALVPQLYGRFFPGHRLHPTLIFGICLILGVPVVLFVSDVFYRLVEVPSISLGKLASKGLKTPASKQSTDLPSPLN